MLIFFDITNYSFQYLLRIPIYFDFLNIEFIFGLDNISILFFVLSNFLIFLCLIFVYNDRLFTFYAFNLFLLQIFLLLIFSILNLLLFYIFFEAVLIPMFLLIGIFGSRERKIWANYMLVFYTICGSLFMLLSILYIYLITGTFSIEYLLNYSFNVDDQYYLWLAFFLSFASKIPIFPLHIWLPEAHVEAPTVGSVILAGILLKLGVYGLIRFNLCFFPLASIFFTPIIYSLCSIGIIYASFAAIRQIDLKRIIAYSSIAHMNLVVLGIFSFNFFGFEGAIFQSISHGFVSSSLFFLIGILYTRYHTRSLYYYSGLVQVMPLYSFFFLFFTMANIALPGTSSFIGELLLLMGCFISNFFITFFIVSCVVLGGSYSLWLYNKIIYGNIKYFYLTSFIDINLKEFFILFFLMFFTLFLGIFPYFLLNFLHSTSIFVLSSFIF
jgi:NADH-quinone oxidoreductase subunit M